MVESEKIKNGYLQLLDLIEKEMLVNLSAGDYFKYLNRYKDKFINESNIQFKEELREFLRGASRYSDEFAFSDQYNHQIQLATSSLYDILNDDGRVSN